MKSLAACSLSTVLAVLLVQVANCAGPRAEPSDADGTGRLACNACHEQETRFLEYGAHRTIACEECHGPGAAHARAEGASRPAMILGDADSCLTCHRRGATRADGVVARIESFEDHLRELEREHRIRLDRGKSGTDCVYCHDPHLLE